VVSDELDDTIPDRPRRPQSIQEHAGELCPDGLVADEVPVGERSGLADVMEQGR
jgi:hypothetical protein